MGKKLPILADLFNAGVQHDADGPSGRDPRDLTPAELASLGHHPTTPLKVIRAICLAHKGTARWVRACCATECPAWAFRLGKHPHLKKKSVLTNEQKRAAAGRAAVARAALAEKRGARKKNLLRKKEQTTGRRGPG